MENDRGKHRSKDFRKKMPGGVGVVTNVSLFAKCVGQGRMGLAVPGHTVAIRRKYLQFRCKLPMQWGGASSTAFRVVSGACLVLSDLHIYIYIYSRATEREVQAISTSADGGCRISDF